MAPRTTFSFTVRHGSTTDAAPRKLALPSVTPPDTLQPLATTFQFPSVTSWPIREPQLNRLKSPMSTWQLKMWPKLMTFPFPMATRPRS